MASALVEVSTAPSALRAAMDRVRSGTGTLRAGASRGWVRLREDGPSQARRLRDRALSGSAETLAAVREGARGAPTRARSAWAAAVRESGLAPLAVLLTRHPVLAWTIALPVLGHAVFGVLMTGAVPVALALFFGLLALIPANQAARKILARGGRRRRGDDADGRARALHASPSRTSSARTPRRRARAA